MVVDFLIWMRWGFCIFFGRSGREISHVVDTLIEKRRIFVSVQFPIQVLEIMSVRNIYALIASSSFLKLTCLTHLNLIYFIGKQEMKIGNICTDGEILLSLSLPMRKRRRWLNLNNHQTTVNWWWLDKNKSGVVSLSRLTFQLSTGSCQSYLLLFFLLWFPRLPFTYIVYYE